MAKKTMRKACFFVGLALSLAACSALPLRPAAPESAAVPSASKHAKRTRSPAAKRTATPSPSKAPKRTRSPKPSATPEALQSPGPTASGSLTSLTPTNLVPSRAPTPTIPSELDCKLIWQSPSNRASFAPLQKFSVGWNVKNNGTSAWDAGSVEFVYLGGAKLHNDGGFQLDRTVAPGERIVLSVAMKAPRNSTKYTTYWGLRQGDTFFCRLMLTIYVRRR